MGALLRNLLRYGVGIVLGVLVVKSGQDLEAVQTAVKTVTDDPAVAGSVSALIVAAVEAYRAIFKGKGSD